MNNPVLYSRHLEPLLELSQSLIEQYREFLKWNEGDVSVMDIGIGDGRMAKEILVPILPNNVKEFFGSDTSESALKHAENIMNMPTFKTVKLDIATSSLPEELKNRFTNVFSSFCLHNIKNTR